MKRRIVVLIVGGVFFVAGGLWFGVRTLGIWQKSEAELAASERLHGQIETVIDARRASIENEEETDLFDDLGSVRILFLGLDTRTAQKTGHCDAIQFIEINSQQQTVHITAVPRGTYAPLPGSGHVPGDYYLSNACEIGGLEYGIAQIEQVLGQKADYVVMIGFSEALGAFRVLKLPTTETLQWLRMRQGYGVGEPQRAYNHSTFLKQMLVKFTPTTITPAETAWEYLLYKFVKTDLSFGQSRRLVRALSEMDFGVHPERITLQMKPSYQVTDIAYDAESLDAYLSSIIEPVAKSIPEGAYTGVTESEAQQRLMDAINTGLSDQSFVERAFEAQLWMQIEDTSARESVHFALLSGYVQSRSQAEEKQTLLADYIIEMETFGQPDWATSARALLASLVDTTDVN